MAAPPAFPDAPGVRCDTVAMAVTRDQADQGQRGDRLTSQQLEELQRLRRRVVELERANEILKAASRFSPRSSTRPGDGHEVCRPAS